MNRRFNLLGVALLIAVMLVAISQYGTIAQGLDDPDGPQPTIEPGSSDQPTEDNLIEQIVEEDIVAPDNPAALVTSAFTYQGQLKLGGTPVNKHCDFVWDIFAASAGGVSLATDSDDNILVANGLFTVIVNVPGTVFDGSARFLEIRVRCPTGGGAFTLLTPRQELHATPYALGLRLPFSHTISNSGSPIFAVTNNSGTSSSPSFLGSSNGGDGVRGLSTGGSIADNGVYGETNSTASADAGVKGVSTSEISFGGYFTNTTASSGGALYANGDAKQSLSGDGFVKAGVIIDNCGNSPGIES